MFHPPSEPAYLGFDLLSGDILAGRDIGLPPYNQVRHLCGLPLAKDFDDLVDQLHIKVRTTECDTIFFNLLILQLTCTIHRKI